MHALIALKMLRSMPVVQSSCILFVRCVTFLVVATLEGAVFVFEGRAGGCWVARHEPWWALVLLLGINDVSVVNVSCQGASGTYEIVPLCGIL